jgi:hypothetical protein
MRDLGTKFRFWGVYHIEKTRKNVIMKG